MIVCIWWRSSWNEGWLPHLTAPVHVRIKSLLLRKTKECKVCKAESWEIAVRAETSNCGNVKQSFATLGILSDLSCCFSSKHTTHCPESRSCLKHELQVGAENIENIAKDLKKYTKIANTRRMCPAWIVPCSKLGTEPHPSRASLPVKTRNKCSRSQFLHRSTHDDPRLDAFWELVNWSKTIFNLRECPTS